MREITITEGLVELKLLDSRIHKAIDRDWVLCIKKNDSKEAKDKFSDEVKASLQSVKDLMAERNKIKSAIVQSNAVTKVTVGGVEMTVAEAIERKTSIEYEQILLDKWKKQYASAVHTETQMNKGVQNNIDKILESIASSDKEDIGEASMIMAENYMETNGYEVINPIDIEAKINELDEQIDVFLSNVDTALSLSNAITKIYI